MNPDPNFVTARFNHGRWIADCPHCNGAERVRPSEEFVCGSHFALEAEARRPNEANIRAKDISRENGQIYPVNFPDDKKKIEKLLRYRPRPNMNWEAGESLDLLRRENAAHGIN